MKRSFISVVTLSLLLAGAAHAMADDVAVVVNRSNPTDSVSMTELRKIVLAQQRQWSNGKKIAVTMSAADRAATLKAVSGMSETDYNVHFMHATFNGEDADPAKIVSSASHVKQAVAAAPAGVGFIRAGDIDESIKVLKINGLAPGQPGYPLSPK
jgi:phosphate transport system substrate-binding protein